MTLATNHPRTAIRWAGVSLALFVLLFARSAAGQGTSRLFPDPMSFEQMSELLTPLELSDAQRTAIGFEHVRYLEGFRLLRAGAIEAYLAEYGSYPLDFRESREEIIDGTKQRRAVLREIETLDAAFFGGVESVLSDEQKLVLPRLADRRERRRLTTNPSAQGWELPRLGNLDLVPEIDALELAGNRRAEIEPQLIAYESSLTPLYRKIHSIRLGLPQAYHDRTWEARRAFEDRMEALQARYDLETAEGQKEYAEAVADAVQSDAGGFSMPGREMEETEKIREEFVRISRLDRRLLADVRPLLEPADADRLERRVSRRAYGILAIPGDSLHRRIAKHMENEETEPELRAALEALHLTYRESRTSLIDRLIVAAELAEFAGIGFNVFHFGADGQQQDKKEETPVGERRREIRDLNERTLETYATLTGEEIPKHTEHAFEIAGGNIGAIVLDAGEADTFVVGGDGESTGAFVSVMVAGPIGEPGDIEAGTITLAGVAGDMAIEFAEGDDFMWAGGAEGEIDPSNVDLGDQDAMDSLMHAVTHVGPRGWLPGPIKEKNVRRLAGDLGLDESSRPLVDALYGDYKSAFAVLNDQVVGPARVASRGFENFGFRLPGTEKTEQLEPAEAFNRVRTAMDAISRLDQRFFDDLAVVLTGEGQHAIIERAARSRRRETLAHLGNGGMFGGFDSGSRENDVDLLALSVSRPVKLGPEDLAACREVLGPYDHESTALYAERWDSSLDAAENQAEKIRESMANAGDGARMLINIGGNDPDGPGGAARRRADAVDETLRALNQRSLPQLAERLSEAGHAALRDAYNRKAFPAIFRDRSALERTFRKALTLEIPAEKRGDVEQLCLDYRGAYAAICERMIDQVRKYDGADEPEGVTGPFDEALFKRYEALQRGLESDRFERRNLSERTRHALRDMLDEGLAAQLGLGDA